MHSLPNKISLIEMIVVALKNPELQLEIEIVHKRKRSEKENRTLPRSCK
jgi:hypothetical protein